MLATSFSHRMPERERETLPHVQGGTRRVYKETPGFCLAPVPQDAIEFKK